jgi:hypothetical protein
MLGHSVGATSILVGFCEIPNFYIENVLTSILIAPICYQTHKVKNFKNYLEILGNEDIIKNKKINTPLFHPDLDYIKYYNKFKDIFPLRNKIEEILTAGNISWNESPYSYTFYFSKFPSGTSTKFFFHLNQICQLGTFENFDYGEEINKEKYEGITVPKNYYFFDKEKIPCILIAGKSDKLIDLDIDIMNLKNELSENPFFRYLEFENMGHYCFLLNNDLMWINFLLKTLKDQIKEINKQSHETYNTEEENEDDKNKFIQKKSNNFSSFMINNEKGNFEYVIN